MRTFLLALAALALAFTACSPTVRTSQPTDVDLSQYETFAYLPNAMVSMDAEQSDDLGQAVVDAVQTQMQQEGYRIDQADPDLLVLLSVKRDSEVDVERDPVYADYAAYPYTTGAYGVNTYYGNYYYNDFATYGDVIGYDTDVYTYKTGTLILNLVDRDSKNTVWKAVSEKSIYDGRVSPQDIAAMVNDMFEEFPAEATTASL